MLTKVIRTVALAALAASAGALSNAQSVKGSITLANLPEQLAINPLSNTVYVAVPNFGTKPYDYLTIIDGYSDTVIKNVEIPPVAYAVAVDPFAQLVYIGGTYTDKNGVEQSEVVVVCAREKRVIGTVHVSSTSGDGIQGLAVNEVNGDLYVTNGSDDEVDVVRYFKVQKRIPTSGEPYGVAVNPLINQVYVSLLNGNVSVINGKTNVITSTTPVGTSDAGIAVNLLNGNVFTTNAVYASSSTVGVLGKAGNVLANVPVGNTPFGVDVDPGTDLAFVANSQDGTVSVITGKTNTVSATLPVSGLFLAVNPFTRKVYVGANDGSTALTVINEK